MDYNIYALESITDIQYLCSKSMHIRYSNVDPEQIRMWYWTIILIKLNALYLRNPIFTVQFNKFSCIETFIFLDTWSNDVSEELFYIREGFYCYGSQKKVNIFVLIIFYI